MAAGGLRELLTGVRRGDPRSIARAITLVENDGARAQSLMRAVFSSRREAVVLGITGAPGTGKSTLVDQMIGRLRTEDKTVGILAVDPSSPFTGGAILGDRIRMMRHSVDPDVFIRSMATRGHLGGLAKATGEAIAIFEAAGKDFVLVETVGVGQDEVDVVKLADFILVILTPGTGDEIQAFKAGIMEIADIFVLNKADSPGADKAEKMIRAMVEIGYPERERPPVVKTVATQGEGIDGLMAEIKHLIRRRRKSELESRRKRLIGRMLQDVTQEKIYRLIAKSMTGSERETYINEIFHRRTDPYTVAEKLVSRLKAPTGVRKRAGMNVMGISHLGIAVNNLEASLARWAALLGARSDGIRELPEMGVRLAKLRFPSGPTIELVAPCGENSTVEKFLDRWGEGIHHVSLEVENLDDAVEKFRGAGLQFVSGHPRKGAEGRRVIFVHPRSLNGVLVELEERPK